MRLTTERKVCATVLSLAVVALGVDRLVLGGASGPAGAAAAIVAAASLAEPSPVPPKPAARARATGEPVASRLKAIVPDAISRDGFAPPSRWIQAIARADEAAREKAAEPPSPAQADPIEARFKRHQLTAVLLERGVPTKALVKVLLGETGKSASRLFEVGDELDGLRLSALDASIATFVDAERNVTVDLEMASQSATKSR